jgi:hypothetical protein
MNTEGTFVVTMTSVSTKPGYQRITLDCCQVFRDLWSAEDYYNSLISEILRRPLKDLKFDNYDKRACDFYTADDVNYHLELKEV